MFKEEQFEDRLKRALEEKTETSPSSKIGPDQSPGACKGAYKGTRKGARKGVKTGSIKTESKAGCDCEKLKQYIENVKRSNYVNGYSTVNKIVSEAGKIVPQLREALATLDNNSIAANKIKDAIKIYNSLRNNIKEFYPRDY